MTVSLIYADGSAHDVVDADQDAGQADAAAQGGCEASW